MGDNQQMCTSGLRSLRSAAFLIGCLLAACGRHESPDQPPEMKGTNVAEWSAFVSNAGRVRLGMTEKEVNEALGKGATRREEAQSPGAAAHVAWDDIGGENPGAALGTFLHGKLVRIEFATAKTAMPHVSREAASSLQSAETVRRSVARTLRMSDVEAVTGSRGLRARWSIGENPGGDPHISSKWVWEVEPGGELLIVDEEDGFAGQPVTRKWNR